MEEIKSYIAHLSPRDRVLLAILIALAVGFLLYMLLWRPFNTAYQEHNDNIMLLREDDRTVTRLASQLKNAGPKKQVDLSTSVLQAVEITGNKYGMTSKIKKRDPQGDDRLLIVMESVKFDDFPLWVQELGREYNIIVDRANIDPTKTPGNVDIHLTLRRL